MFNTGTVAAGDGGEPTMTAQEFQFLVGSYKKEYYLWEVAEMWRKVALTGVVSIMRAGSMLQIVIASAISLGFLVMHARCWPFQRAEENRLKLGTEVVLMLVFLSTAVLRAAYTKQELVDAGMLHEDDLTWVGISDIKGGCSLFSIVSADSRKRYSNFFYK